MFPTRWSKILIGWRFVSGSLHCPFRTWAEPWRAWLQAATPFISKYNKSFIYLTFQHILMLLELLSLLRQNKYTKNKAYTLVYLSPPINTTQILSQDPLGFFRSILLLADIRKCPLLVIGFCLPETPSTITDHHVRIQQGPTVSSDLYC